MKSLLFRHSADFLQRTIQRVFISLSILVFCCFCQQNKNKYSLELSEKELIEKGRVLSKAYCSSCHLYPDPLTLDKQTWSRSVLPAMRKLTFSEAQQNEGWNSWFSNDPAEDLENEFELIEAFYISEAPDQLEIPAAPAPISGIPGFVVETPVFERLLPNLTTFADYDSVSNLIWVGDRLKKLYGINPENFSIEKELELPSTPVQISLIDSSNLAVLVMGNMDPSDLYLGKLLQIDLSSKEETVLLDSLNRPVYFKDIKWKNGKQQWILSEFGNIKGGLSLRTSTTYEDLINLPGCRKSIPVDWDRDGDLDFIAGFGQAHEAIYWIENRGDGKFLNHILEQFQPSFGLSDLAVEDVNQDGFPDIILVNGDNADLSPILKPYHGVRIYFGKGNAQLELNWFYHIDGAMSMVAEDFDQDGTIEMAVVSYFADFRNDNRLDWLYFDHLETEEKKVYNLPIPLKGRWLTITSGDVDQDGDLDLLTGSFMFQPGFNYESEINNWTEAWEPFFVLKNQSN